MNLSTWRNRPKFITHCPDNIDSILFIDESGDSSLKHLLKSIENNQNVERNNQHFTLMGCGIDKSDIPIIRREVLQIKNKYWENGEYGYKKGIKRVCFHSREIRKGYLYPNNKLLHWQY